MKHLPRALNRIILFFTALITIAIGTVLVLVAVWKPAAKMWDSTWKTVTEWYSSMVDKTHVAIGGVQDFSWMTIAWVAIFILLALFGLAWILSQGGGGTKDFELPDSKRATGGTVTKLSFLDDLVMDAIGDDRWVASAKTKGWQVKDKEGLALTINTHKGADPTHVKELADQAVARLDSVLGQKLPILVRLTTNWRTTVQSADRVE